MSCPLTYLPPHLPAPSPTCRATNSDQLTRTAHHLRDTTLNPDAAPGALNPQLSRPVTASTSITAHYLPATIHLARAHTHTHAHTRSHTHTRARTHTRAHTHARTHTHTHAHTHTQAHTRNVTPSNRAGHRSYCKSTAAIIEAKVHTPLWPHLHLYRVQVSGFRACMTESTLT